MSEPTGVLEIDRAGKTTRYTWNGDAEDRAAARKAFEDATAMGAFLGVVLDAPGKGHQVRTFDEVEEVEREKGVVTARISSPLVGG